MFSSRSKRAIQSGHDISILPALGANQSMVLAPSCPLAEPAIMVWCAMLLHIFELFFPCPFKGNLWKESLDILKMAVSHSSHLDTPPARPASSVWTVHDSSWSAEAMMIKKDLPGRTLDFTFDLSATPVIGRRATPEIPGEIGRENKLLSQVSTVDLSTWKKPHLSQVEVLSLLNSFYCLDRKRAIL